MLTRRMHELSEAVPKDLPLMSPELDVKFELDLPLQVIDEKEHQAELEFWDALVVYARNSEK